MESEDQDAIKHPWIVDEDGLLVDPAQLRMVASKLIDILDEVWESGLGPEIFGEFLPLAAQTIEGIHQLVSREHRAWAYLHESLLPIYFPEQTQFEDKIELHKMRVLLLKEHLN